MTDEAKKARAEYKRNYYQAHKDKYREYMERYWNKKAQQQTEEADSRPADPQNCQR